MIERVHVGILVLSLLYLRREDDILTNLTSPHLTSPFFAVVVTSPSAQPRTAARVDREQGYQFSHLARQGHPRFSHCCTTLHGTVGREKTPLSRSKKTPCGPPQLSIIILRAQRLFQDPPDLFLTSSRHATRPQPLAALSLGFASRPSAWCPVLLPSPPHAWRDLDLSRLVHVAFCLKPCVFFRIHLQAFWQASHKKQNSASCHH